MQGSVRPGALVRHGQWVILEIDVQGAMSVLEHQEFDPITLFIDPGGMDELERRLRSRGSESEESITQRLKTASAEMRYKDRYQRQIINGSVETAVAEICQYLKDQKEPRPCSKN